MELPKNLTEEQRIYIEKEFKKKRKYKSTAYLLWILGFHYLYLKKISTWLLLCLSCFILVGLIWWFVDLFRIPGLVRDYNDDLLTELILNAKIIY